MTETDGPRRHPDPLAELEAELQQELAATEATASRIRDGLALVRALRRSHATLTARERANRAWKMTGGALITLLGLPALLKLLAGKPPAAAAVTAVALGATGAAIWLLPPIFERGPERDKPPRPAPTATAPTHPSETSPSPTPRSPSPSQTPTTSPTPSPSPSPSPGSSEPGTGIPTAVPEVEIDPSVPPVTDGTPTPEPPEELPDEEPPPAEPEEDCPIRLDVPPLMDLCLL